MKKRIIAALTAATMMVAMASTAFASESKSFHLYKNGKYDSTNKESNLSMGDGALLQKADVDISGSQVTITIGIDENFRYHSISGYLTKISAKDAGYSAVLVDSDDNDINDKMVITCTTSNFSYGNIINLDFTVTALDMPIASSGDLVIFE